MKKKFMRSLMVSSLLISTSIRVVFAQSWNVTGNNATGNSKLGTANLAPLKFFTL